MSLKELQIYLRLLDRKITEKKEANAPSEEITALIIYRGTLDYKIKSRTILGKLG